MIINKTYRLLIASVILILTMFSCDKPKTYSPIPEITHKSTDFIIGKDTLDNEVYKITVRFSFVDGDGDLGLSPSDTLGDFAPGKEFYYNLKFSFYEKKEGVFEINNKIKPYYRFQSISKTQTTNKVLKGDMLVEIELSTLSNYSDSSKFEFFINDRALNQSNIEETSELYLND